MKKAPFWNKLLMVFVQTIPVILGIFIALYVNRVESERADSKYIAELIQKAKDQIITDTIQLSSDIKAHSELVELINANLENEISIQELLLKSNGLNISPANSIFFKILIDSKVEKIEIKKASNMFEILDFIKAKERYEEQIQLTIYDSLTDNSKKAKMKFFMLINDFSQLEMQLLKSYKKFLEMK